MWLTIPHKCLQFCDPCLNSYEEIQLKAVRGGILGRFFFNLDKCRPEVASDVLSGATLVYTYVDVDIRAKFGDSRSNCYRDVRLSQTHDERRHKAAVTTNP